jgi:hypothetical protein
MAIQGKPMSDLGAEWVDDAAGPLVRPYTLTGGRTRPTHSRLDVATQVVAAAPDAGPTDLGPEHQKILNLCQRPLSVAEVASYTRVPLGVARVLLDDLIQRGDIVVGTPTRPEGGPDRDLLQAILDGIRAI